MPPRKPATDSEQLAHLSASLEAFERYNHERWHKLNNDLTPLFQMPEKMAREVGKLEGVIGEKITSAIEKAILPLTQDIAELRADVDALKEQRQQMTGARMLLIWLGQTVAAIITTLIAVVAYFKGAHG